MHPFQTSYIFWLKSCNSCQLNTQCKTLPHSAAQVLILTWYGADFTNETDWTITKEIDPVIKAAITI